MELNTLGETATAIIEAGVDTSSAIDRGDRAFLGFYLGATAWTGTTFTLLAASTPGGDFLPLVDEAGTALGAITVTLNARITLPSAMLARVKAYRYLKIKSSANESAARAIEVSMGG